MSAERWRLFVAVPVADEVKAAIAKFLAGLDPTHRLKAAGPRFLHLTVRFFGAVAVAEVPALKQRLAAACQRVKPFKLRAEGLGDFDHRVLWIGLHGRPPALHRLAAAVTAETSAFGDHVERRRFTPHITIGKRPPHDASGGALASLLARHRSTAFGEWRVDHLELVRSRPGPGATNYTTVARLPLGKAC